MNIKPQLATSTRPSGGNFAEAVEFAQVHGFQGIDWNLDCSRLPASTAARSLFYEQALGSGLVSRFHAPCQDVEIGHKNKMFSDTAVEYLKMYIEFLKDFPQAYLTLHIGSRSIPEDELSWDNAVGNLTKLVDFGGERGVTVCLENLKRGWTSEPEKMASLVEKSGAMVTLDTGHARGSRRILDGLDTLESFIQPFSQRIRNIHLYEIETADGRHHEPENLDNLRTVLNWALSSGINWWVIELTSYDQMLRCKKLLDREFSPVTS